LIDNSSAWQGLRLRWGRSLALNQVPRIRREDPPSEYGPKGADLRGASANVPKV